MSTERRSSPRYSVDVALQVSVPELQTPFAAHAHTLSRTSVEITCHTELVAALLQQQQLPQLCNVVFTMGDKAADFDIAAQVLTHRRMSQFQYAVVLLFRHTGEQQECLLDQLLNAANKP